MYKYNIILYVVCDCLRYLTRYPEGGRNRRKKRFYLFMSIDLPNLLKL